MLDAATELTVGQLRARVSRLALEADPSAVEHGLVEGLADRRVVAYQNPDLTGSIAIQSAHPDDVAAAMAHIEEIARSLKTGDETRTMDQIRNDVAIDLLRGTRVGATGGGGKVVVTIPAATLEAGADHPGIFEGFGPVTAEIARKAVMERIDGEWVFQVTDNGQDGGHGNPLPTAHIDPATTGPGRLSHLCVPRLSHALPPMRSRPSPPGLVGGPNSQRQSWGHCVAITTWRDITSRGRWNVSPVGTIGGRARSVTPTPGGGRRPMSPDWAGRRKHRDDQFAQCPGAPPG